jgi:hypothetical protein
MAKKKQDGPLAKALRSKIGRLCHFTDPRNGEVVEGYYQRGRKVKRMVGARRLKPEELGEGARSGFMFDDQIFTVPRNIKITFGAAPHSTKGASK